MSNLALTVVQASGQQTSVDGLTTEDSYASLTACIQKATGIPEPEQRLLIGEGFVPIDDGSAKLGDLGFTSGIVVNLIRMKGLVGKTRGQREEVDPLHKDDPYSHDRATEDIHVQFESDGFVFIFVRVKSTMGQTMWKYKGPLENPKEGTFEIRVIRCEHQMGKMEYETLSEKEKDGVRPTQGWIDRVTGTLSADGEEVTISAAGIYSDTPPSAGPFRKTWELKRWDGKEDESKAKSNASCCIIS